MHLISQREFQEILDDEDSTLYGETLTIQMLNIQELNSRTTFQWLAGEVALPECEFASILFNEFEDEWYFTSD